MDQLKNKYTYFQRAVHRWKARRDIPFRKRFFVGYDLHGNTYWEFTPDGNMQRLRRKMEPFQTLFFKADYFSLVPPQWLQWLRRTRNTPPSLDELTDDMNRQQALKIRAQHIDRVWQLEKQKQEQVQEAKLAQELSRARTDSISKDVPKDDTGATNSNPAPNDDFSGASRDADPHQSDPWKEADANQGGSIEEATIKPAK